MFCITCLLVTRSVRRLMTLARSKWVATLVWSCVGGFLLLNSQLFGPPNYWFNMDEEKNLATAFSVALMFAASIAAAMLATLAVRERSFSRLRITAGYLLAAVLAAMALDDWFVWHEKLEGLAGLPWTYWYAPVPALAVAAGVVLGSALSSRSRLYLMLGFMAWLAAGVLETFFWGPDSLEFQSPVTMPMEEVLEMAAPIALFAGLSRAIVSLASEEPTETGTAPSQPRDN